MALLHGLISLVMRSSCCDNVMCFFSKIIVDVERFVPRSTQLQFSQAKAKEMKQFSATGS
jgi:hypothetical protein